MKHIYLFILISGCGGPSNFFENITNYEVNPNTATPSGIRVDTGGYEVDLIKLDNRINKIESCILEVAKTTDNSKWSCVRQTEELRRDLLIIKIVPPVFSKCSDWEFIDVEAPEELCLAKGVVPSDVCVCRWRCAVQDDWVLVSPPSLNIWDIGRIQTSCNDIWNSPYSKCLGE